MAIIIGLTGSIASGKSTVAKMFKDYDIPVIDADIISRQVVEPGQLAYQGIVATFGETILLDDGTINRKQLGDIVFSDKDKREKLNAIVHPAVREKMLEKKANLIEKGEPMIVLDIPLLFESKLEYLVDKIVVVYVDEKTQLKRLIDRDQITKQAALDKIASQLPVDKKAEKADFVIDNGGTIEQTRDQLLQFLKNSSVG